MQIQKIQNYGTSFSAQLDMKPVNGMITDEEILELQEKAKKVGNKNSLIKIALNKPYSRSEGDAYEGSVYHGIKMDVATYHKGKLDLKSIGKEVQMTPLYDCYGELKEEFRPFNIISQWLENAFKE